jgi:NAD(P)-dependent dehydrogenase (short-subunit alcohol dehydrogenase family)
MTRWSLSDAPALSSSTVLVTGATSGLGLHSACALASRGARVLVAGRDPARTAEAVRQAQAAAALGGSAEPLELDLASLASVATAAAAVAERVDRLDVLMNNAGIMAPPYWRTKDGFETQIGTNHLGHFALTARLLPLLEAAQAPRVVTVSSAAHRVGRLDPDDLQWERRRYEAWSAYGSSKLANLLFTSELQRRADAAGSPLLAVAAHPGWSATNLQLAGPRFAHHPIGRAATRLANAVVGQSAADGALPQLYAATMPDVRGDDYIGPDGFAESRGGPTRVGRSGAARDPELARRLWERSEELTSTALRPGG